MTYLLLVLQLLPVVIHAVMAIQAALPATGQGATRKALVMSSIQAAASAGGKTDDEMTAALSALVDQVVGVLHATGVFTKSTPAPAVKA